MASRGRGNRTDDQTREITGLDATMDEAQVGDAGNGADPFGGDLSGGVPRPLEDSPDEPGDILPHQVRRFDERSLEEEDEEEREVTARPMDTHAIDVSELP